MKHYIYKLFLLILLFFTSSNFAFSKDFRFIQVTDLHLRPEQYSIENFQKIIDGINKTKNIEFVAFTGDNVDKAGKEIYVKFLTMANTLNVPYYVVVGNHDVFKFGGFSKVDFVKTVKKYNKNQKYKNVNYVFEKNNFIFIVLDGAREFMPSPGGYYRDETLQWLDKQLTKHKDKDVIILQHFPMKLRHTERDAYKNERYETLISKHKNIRAIFAGHFHEHIEYKKDNIFYFVTGKAFGPDASYKVIDVIEEKNPTTHKKEYNFYTQIVHVRDL